MPKPPRRTACVLYQHPQNAPGPFYRTVVDLLLELGYEVELFASGGSEVHPSWGDRVRPRPITYTLGWLGRRLWDPVWRRCRLLLATCRLPLAAAGLIAAANGKPLVCLADELFTGAYYGDDPRHWVRLANWAHRRAALTVITDLCRAPILRGMAGLPATHPLVMLPVEQPGDPQPLTAAEIAARRAAWGVPEGAAVLLHSGAMDWQQGAPWLIDHLGDLAADECLVLHQGGKPREEFAALARRLARHERLRTDFGERVSWEDLRLRVGAADLAFVIYRHQGPQFQCEGLSSTKLNYALRCGVPVVASRQPSFEFLEAEGCGALIDGPADLGPAIRRLRDRLPEAKAAARRVHAERIALRHYLPAVADALRKVAP